ncbi:MAG: MtrAB system histidine kinase MtrB [Sporichthyaceae bacterium]
MRPRVGLPAPVRGLVFLVGRPVRGVVRTWRRSILLRVVSATLVLSIAVLAMLGQLVMREVRDGLVDAKVSTSLAQAEAGFAAAQARLEAAGTPQRANVGQLLTQVVTELRQSAGSTSLYELVLIPAPGVDSDLPAGRSRIATGGVLPASIPQALSDELAVGSGDRVDRFVGLCYGQAEDQCVASADEPAFAVGTQFTVAGAGSYQLWFMFPLADEQETLALVRSRLTLAGVALLVLLAAIALLVTRSVVRPVRSAAQVAQRLAAGELSERMVQRGEDELAKLASSFNGMAAALQRQIRQLEDLSRMQQQFVSDVSHELRTPLTTIRMAADVIYDDRDVLPAPAARSAELMHDQVGRFESLLTDLLEISRFDAGVAALDAEPSDLRDVVRRVVDLVEPVAVAQYGSAIRLELPARECVADIDTRRIERVLRNLVINALEHGEGREIRVRVGADEHAVAVTVRDYGVGLRAEETTQVFNRFWRADPSRQRRSGGTGLGLSISQQDAHLHGGWLQAWGEPRIGAQFRLTLPRTAAGVLVGSPLDLEPADRRGPRRAPALPAAAGPNDAEMAVEEGVGDA